MRCLQGRLSAGNLEIISSPGLNGAERLRLTRRTLRGLLTRRRPAASPTLKEQNNNNNNGGSIMRRVGDGPVSCHRTNKSITNHISAAVNHQRSPRAQDPPTISPGPSPTRLHFISPHLRFTRHTATNSRHEEIARPRSFLPAVTCPTGAGGGQVCPSGIRTVNQEPSRTGRGVSVVQKDRKSADTAG